MKIFADQNHPQLAIELSAQNTALVALLEKTLSEHSSLEEGMKFVKQWNLNRLYGAYGKYGVRGSMYTWPVYG